MFNAAIVAMQSALFERQIEERLVAKAKESMPADMFRSWLADHEREKRLAKAERDKERRHREMCEAIRSTSFWRF